MRCLTLWRKYTNMAFGTANAPFIEVSSLGFLIRGFHSWDKVLRQENEVSELRVEVHKHGIWDSECPSVDVCSLGVLIGGVHS